MVTSDSKFCNFFCSSATVGIKILLMNSSDAISSFLFGEPRLYLKSAVSLKRRCFKSLAWTRI